MSYILEALKESQRSRDEQHVPDIMTVHGIPEPENEQPARSRWMLPVVFIVCVAAAAGWWFAGSKQVVDVSVSEQLATETLPEKTLPGTTQLDKTKETLAVQAADPAETITPKPVPLELKGIEPETTSATAAVSVAKIVSPALVEQSISNKPAEETIENPPVVEPVVSLPEKVTPKAVVVTERPRPVVMEEKVAVKQVVTPQPTAAPLASVQPVSDVVPSEEKAEAVAVVESVVKEPVPVLSSAQVTQETVVEKPSTENVPVSPEPERVPHYRELPYDVQQAVSGVKYSVHLYSPEPSRRLVKINGIVRREGSEVSPGLVLDQVTPDGAIFTYREYRFRVPVR